MKFIFLLGWLIMREKAGALYWHSRGEDFSGFTSSGNLKHSLVRGASMEGERIESPTRMSPFMKQEFYRWFALLREVAFCEA